MQNSKIEWTDHTFNPWWGCQRVSPGCEHCYAETLAKRYGHDVWGPARTTGRRMMGDNYWRQPLRWNEAAAKAGQRARIFCASMADVFEEHPAVENARMQLFNLIDVTPHLDWLLLTKRPENIARMMAPWLEGTHFPENIWIGTSVEDQRRADERIPHLLAIPAKVRFLSCEPLLGALDLSHWLVSCSACGERPNGDDTRWRIGYNGWEHACSIPQAGCFDSQPDNAGLHWIIGGGESGHEARYCDLRWARALRDQCAAAGAAFFWKQWGEYVPKSQAPDGCQEPPVGPRGRRSARALADLLGETAGDRTYWRVGKHAASRLLDGREWNEFPR